jgi:hypothetical protein
MNQLKEKNSIAKIFNDSPTIDDRVEQMTAGKRKGVPDDEPQILTPHQLARAKRLHAGVMQNMGEMKFLPNMN